MPVSRLGAWVVAIVIVSAVAVGPTLLPFAPTAQDLSAPLRPPLARTAAGLHLLGTDFLGRDVLARLAHGARLSIGIGVLTALLSAALGMLVGLVAGLLGSWTDKVLMRCVDVQLSIPRILLALAILALLGPSTVNVLVVLAVTGWVVFARVVRGEVLTLVARDFVEAARAMGAPAGRVILRHLCPNVMGSVIVLATFAFARAIIAEAALSFLGAGIQPPTPSWGLMLSEGRQYIYVAWWLAIFPGLSLSALALVANVGGDWLRDQLDPAARGVAGR